MLEEFNFHHFNKFKSLNFNQNISYYGNES